MTAATTLVKTVGKGEAMTGGQIDKVCIDWLRENYGEGFVSEYRAYSLVIPMWNTPELNEALEALLQVLCIAFAPDESFGTVEYYDVRRKLKLSDDRTPIPEVFLRAFVKANE